EYRWTSGVETTTGPLGQGIATSVGMALASKWQAERFNRPGAELFDFDVYALAGDGCLMEGVSHESASLAGHLRLDNLCWLFDNNHITIDGNTALAYDDDVLSRFEGYGWNVLRVGDANDANLLRRAFEEFKAETGRPTLIVVDSHIGWGSPNKQDTESAHGEPLGEEEVRLTKQAYGWPEEAQFLVPDGVQERFAEGIGKRGAELRAAWAQTLASYREQNPELAAQIEQMQRRELPDGWDAGIPSFEADEEKGLATRKASNKVENAIAERVPWLIAGSADLTDSTSVRLTFDGAVNFEPGSFAGRQIHFGIREHAAAAACNGLSLSKLRPLWSTYLTFSDYGRPGIRLSALMELPVIHLFTHDSIGLGEDGPTHQPIEQLASLRAIPHLDVIRPADANEVAEAWRIAVQRTHNPIALVLTRQNVPVLDRSRYASAEGARRGGYVLADCEGEPELILIATGSEVQLAVGAHETLSGEGIRSRVVSLPCWEIFDRQDAAYRDEVLPPGPAVRVAIEEASTLGWERYVGSDGTIIGIHTFGQSAPFKEIEEEFGFTPDKIAAVAREAVEKGGKVRAAAMEEER
ncbi:MAG TPA: transketolase, partial [Solirubrobacterales bacterium]|nr:transketolase [Solirubrobacterales bacterium]